MHVVTVSGYYLVRPGYLWTYIGWIYVIGVLAQANLTPSWIRHLAKPSHAKETAHFESKLSIKEDKVCSGHQ